MKKAKWFVVSALLIALVMPASAQEQSAEDLGELRREAQRLELLSEVPAEARERAAALLDRMEALDDLRTEHEVARLRAYVDALRAGESIAVAREMAQQAVSQSNIDLIREQESLREELKQFSEDFPEAAPVLQRLRLNGQVQLIPAYPGGSPTGQGRMQIRVLGPGERLPDGLFTGGRFAVPFGPNGPR